MKSKDLYFHLFQVLKIGLRQVFGEYCEVTFSNLVEIREKFPALEKLKIWTSLYLITEDDMDWVGKKAASAPKRHTLTANSRIFSKNFSKNLSPPENQTSGNFEDEDLDRLIEEYASDPENQKLSPYSRIFNKNMKKTCK